MIAAEVNATLLLRQIEWKNVTAPGCNPIRAHRSLPLLKPVVLSNHFARIQDLVFVLDLLPEVLLALDRVSDRALRAAAGQYQSREPDRRIQHRSGCDHN